MSAASHFPNKQSQPTCFFRICNGDKVEPSQLPKDSIVKLHFQSNDLDGLLWQQRTSDRLRRAIGRLQGLVARIRVSLDDINGPEGGVDKRCSVEILLRGSTPVAVSATSRSWQDSVDAVATRIRQRIALQLHRATVVEHPSTTPLPVRARTGAPGAVAISPRRLRLG
jgi:putative sigma-54 modulation protein